MTPPTPTESALRDHYREVFTDAAKTMNAKELKRDRRRFEKLLLIASGETRIRAEEAIAAYTAALAERGVGRSEQAI
jgi:hypothetical protein